MNASRQPTVFVLRGPTFERVRDNLTSFLARLPSDKAWEVTVKPHSAKRSEQQNRYLWGICYPAIVQATGHDATDLHDFFLGEHFGWEEYSVMGVLRKRPKQRSRMLSRVEFAGYVDYLQRRAAALGVYIPDPDPMLVAA